MEAIDSEIEEEETRWFKLVSSFMLEKVIANDQLEKVIFFVIFKCCIFGNKIQMFHFRPC